jgi:hypothetical protein
MPWLPHYLAMFSQKKLQLKPGDAAISVITWGELLYGAEKIFKRKKYDKSKTEREDSRAEKGRTVNKTRPQDPPLFLYSCFSQLLNLILILALLVLFLVGACASRKLPETSAPKIASQAMAPAGEGELADLAVKITAKFGEDTFSVLPMFTALLISV